jgi:acetyltransferase-like isoleucine patch superfamily enzyme
MGRTITVGRLKEKVADLQRARMVAINSVKHVTPPEPSRYGAIGKNSFVIPPARILTPQCIFIGQDVEVLEHAWFSVVPVIAGVTPKLTIGDRCSIGRMSHLAVVGEVTLGDDVQLSDNVFIADTFHEYSDPHMAVIDQPMSNPLPVHIGNGAFLGVNAIVLQGVTVGEGAHIAHGAVVTKDVAPFTMVAGNPARPVRRYDDATKEWVSL